MSYLQWFTCPNGHHVPIGDDRADDDEICMECGEIAEDPATAETIAKMFGDN